jgi:hypothetical protein
LVVVQQGKQFPKVEQPQTEYTETGETHEEGCSQVLPSSGVTEEEGWGSSPRQCIQQELVKAVQERQLELESTWVQRETEKSFAVVSEEQEQVAVQSWERSQFGACEWWKLPYGGPF